MGPGKATGGYATPELLRAPGTAPAAHRPTDPQRTHALSRPLPVSGAPLHPSSPGPATPRRQQGRRRPSSPSARARRGQPRLPRPARLRYPRLFGGPVRLRRVGPGAQRRVGSRLRREEAWTKSRQQESAAGPGLLVKSHWHAKGRGFGLGKGRGQKLPPLRDATRREKEGGAWSSALGMRRGLHFRFLGAEMGGGLEAGPQAESLCPDVGGAKSFAGCRRSHRVGFLRR